MHIDGPSSSNADPKNLEAWTDLIIKIKELTLSGITSQIIQYDDDARRLEQQSMIPGWNYCQFFNLKEVLSFTFELLSLGEQALLQYDELEACFFQTMAEQGAPWFKRFGGTESGDDNPNPFKIQQDKNYKDKINQNAISIFDFRIYLFSRQCYHLNLLRDPINIFERTRRFISGFSVTLREYRESLSSNFREIWTFSVVLNIIRHCDELLAVSNHPGEFILRFEGLKGTLYQCARYQVSL